MMEKFQRAYLKPDASGKIPEANKDDVVYINDLYQVNVRDYPDGWTWLSIKRLDKDAIHDWRHLQQIKNELTDPEREGLEIYPAESRLVDSSNQYHIYVLPKGEKIPIGFQERLIVVGHDDRGKVAMGGSRQRPFEINPSDALSLEEVKKKARDCGVDV